MIGVVKSCLFIAIIFILVYINALKSSRIVKRFYGTGIHFITYNGNCYEVLPESDYHYGTGVQMLKHKQNPVKTKESAPVVLSGIHSVQLDIVDVNSLILQTNNNKTSQKPLKGDIAVIVELTGRLRRWAKIPLNDPIHNGPPKNHHYRLVLAVTADVSEKDITVPKDVATTLISLSLFMKNYKFLPVLFTISKPLIDLSKKLGIPYYYGYEHNKFFLPRVDKLFGRLYDSIDADYYGVINADILISDSVFSILDAIDELATNGTISSIRGLSGVVRDITPFDFISKVISDDGLTLPFYRETIYTLSHAHHPYRHHCSADYFIFSKTTPLSVFGPYVLGRYNIDNYLLARMFYCNGTMVDTTFSISGFHQGTTTNIDKMKKTIVLDGDIQYNIELMKQNSERKGCLIRDAGLVLYERDGQLISTQWNKDEKRALSEFKKLKKSL